MIRRAIILAALAFVAAPALAQDSVSPLYPVTPEAIAELQAAMPVPASTAPLTDTMGGAVGNDPTEYARAKHQHPRITNSPTVFTVAGGTFSGTFPAGLFASKPTIALTWATTGAIGPVSCEMRTITATAFTGRCTTLLGLIAAGSGIEVDIVALPNSAP